jgi:Phage portal protein
MEKMGIPPDDAQFLETRRFQVEEIARFLNMPPHKLRDLSHATFSNIEEENLEWVVDTLRPWLVRWEQELNRKLIRPLERNLQFTEHLVDGLLRGNTTSRYAAYAVGRQWGWLSADDIRERENMNPLPEGQGQIYLVPLNMQPADMAEANAQPEPPSPPPEPARPDAGQRAKLIAAHRGIIVEALGRMVRKETNALRRAAKQGPQALREWLGDFYEEHRAAVTAAILPGVRAHLSHTDGSHDPFRTADELAGAFLEGHRARLGAILHARPQDLLAVVEAEATRWEIEHPAMLADQLMTEELTYALTA